MGVSKLCRPAGVGQAEGGAAAANGQEGDGAAAGAAAAGAPPAGAPGRSEEVFHPVACTECGTEVGVYEPSTEFYHFFNVFPSHA